MSNILIITVMVDGNILIYVYFNNILKKIVMNIHTRRLFDKKRQIIIMKYDKIISKKLIRL